MMPPLLPRTEVGKRHICSQEWADGPEQQNVKRQIKDEIKTRDTKNGFL
ncbi:hypothetical protein [Paenibacillus sp. FSL R7-0272]